MARCTHSHILPKMDVPEEKEINQEALTAVSSIDVLETWTKLRYVRRRFSVSSHTEQQYSEQKQGKPHSGSDLQSPQVLLCLRVSEASHLWGPLSLMMSWLFPRPGSERTASTDIAKQMAAVPRRRGTERSHWLSQRGSSLSPSREVAWLCVCPMCGYAKRCTEDMCELWETLCF